MLDSNVTASHSLVPRFYHAPVPGFIPGNLTAKEFQHAGAEYALGRNHCLIGDPPGLTKTAQSIMVDNAIESNRTLVICPASLRLNWEREIWAWSTIENVSTYPVIKAKDGISHLHDFNIISYSLAANPDVQEAIMALHWDHVILDEAHALKDPKGNTRTKLICAVDMLPSVTGRFTALSGTIMPNRPDECYNIMRLLDWESINNTSLEGFREFYYEEGGGMIRGPVYDPIKDVTTTKLHWSDKVLNVPVNMEDLGYRLRKHIMVRRKKADVLPHLPQVRMHLVPIEETAAIRKALKNPAWKPVANLYDMDPTAFDVGLPIDGEVSTARRELGEAKAPQVAKYVKQLIEEGVDKIVIGAWHRSVLSDLFDRLKEHGLVYMDGGTTPKNKQLAVDLFQERDEIKIILGQTQTIGEGWTLTEAQDVVNAEPDWVPGKNQQLIDRINRMGQTGSSLTAHLCVAPGSMDERIVGNAVKKDISIHAALD